MYAGHCRTLQGLVSRILLVGYYLCAKYFMKWRENDFPKMVGNHGGKCHMQGMDPPIKTWQQKKIQARIS